MKNKRGRDLSIKDMPPELPMILDSVSTSGSLSAEINPNEKMYHYVGQVSKTFPSSGTVEEIKTGLGGKIRRSPTNKMQTTITYGVSDPRRFTEEPYRMKDIMGDIATLDIPDVKGKEKGQVLPIPKIFEDFPILDGEDNIFSHVKSDSIQIHKMRRTFGLKTLIDPKIVQAIYLQKIGLIDNIKDPRIRSVRGVFNSRWFVSNHQGWESLAPIIKPYIENIRKPWQLVGTGEFFSDGQTTLKLIRAMDIDGMGYYIAI